MTLVCPLPLIPISMALLLSEPLAKPASWFPFSDMSNHLS